MGQYAIILSATTMLTTYSSLGFPSALNRYTVAYRSKNQLSQLKNFVFSGICVYLVIEFIIVSILVTAYLAIGFVPNFLDFDPYLLALFVVAFISVGQILITVTYTISSALQNSRYYSIPIIMRVLLQIPFGILFAIILKMRVYGLVIGLFTAEILVSLYSLYIIITNLGIGRFSITETKKMLSFSVPGYIVGLLLASYNFGIKYYVVFVFKDASSINGQELIALYQYGAFAVVNLLLIAENMLKIVYRPIIFKYFERKKYSEMQSITITVGKLFILLIIFGSFLIYAFSPIIIPLLTCSDYLAGIPVIPILLLAGILGYLRTLLAYGHTLYYKNYWAGIAGTVAIITAVIVGVFTIPHLQLIGLGLSYLCIPLIQFLFLMAVSQHYFKIRYDPRLLIKLLLSLIISISIGVLLNFMIIKNSQYTILISYSISAVIFLLLSFILRLITKKDIVFIKNLITTYRDLIAAKIQKNSG